MGQQIPHERDADIRMGASRVSAALADCRADVAIGAATLYIVCLVEMFTAEAPTLGEYAAAKLRTVADLLDPE